MTLSKDEPLAKFNIMAIVDDKDKYSVQYTDSKKAVWVLEDDKVTQIGRITENGLEKLGQAESYGCCMPVRCCWGSYSYSVTYTYTYSYGYWC